MTLFEELSARGLFAQMTNEQKTKELLDNSKIKFYVGFDATADSLTAGHFVQLMVMSRLQKAGHTPVVLLGTGTTMVGDPTGKTDMRKMLTKEQIDYNAKRFQQQMSRFIDFSDSKALIVRNGDWLLNLNYMEFLRDIGVHFTVNRMLAAECFKTRYEKGLTFIEFNYMIMKSYDFLHLYRTQNVIMECGGDDQWSNILGGIDLVRRVEGKEVYGVTYKLLTTKDGKKMGKTEKGAIWLDPEKTSPYEFFQYWRNVDDGDVINCLNLLTFVPVEKIKELSKLSGSDLNVAKELLAFEVTKLVHGEREAQKALDAARALFAGGSAKENIPLIEISDFSDATTVLDVLVSASIVPSRSEGRRLITQGGISLDDKRVTDPNMPAEKSQFESGVIIRKGKKNFYKVVIK